MFKQVNDMIKEYKEDDGELPATVYLPMEDYKDFYNEYRGKHPMKTDEPSLRGIPIKHDDLIRVPQILPDHFNAAYPFCHKDPPREHIDRLIDIEKLEYTEPLRHSEVHQYKTSVFLKPYCKWQRFDEEMVEKYGSPVLNPSISNLGGKEVEYTKTEFDHFERQKFGFEQSFTHEAVEQLDAESRADDRAERQIPSEIHKTLWRVNVSPVYMRRKRTIKGPYPVLDIEHREELKFGKSMVTYEGLVMRNIDTDVHELRVEQ